MPLETLTANLRHAASTGGGANIGGGIFMASEIRAALDRINRLERIGVAVVEILPLLDKAGVISLYVISSEYERQLCSPDRIRISELLETLISETKIGENDGDH